MQKPPFTTLSSFPVISRCVHLLDLYQERYKVVSSGKCIMKCTLLFTATYTIVEKNDVPFLITRRWVLSHLESSLYALFLHSRCTSLQLVIRRSFMLTASNRPAKAWGTLLVYPLPLLYLPFATWVAEHVLLWLTRPLTPIQVPDNLPTQLNPPHSSAPTIWPWVSFFC